MNYHIDYLANHPNQINNISEILFNEWSHLMPGITIQLFNSIIAKRLNFDTIPLSLIALNDKNEWIGIVSITRASCKKTLFISNFCTGVSEET